MPDKITFTIVVEIAIIFIFYYFLLLSLKGTRGAGIFKGVIFVAVITAVVIWQIAKLVGLIDIKFALENWVLTGFLFVLAIVFQPELRRLLMDLGQSRIFGFLSSAGGRTMIDELVAAVTYLAAQKQGALIALEKEIGLRPYIEGGVKLDSEVSKELIETIFYPGSALHDGGVIIKDDRITAAGCLFPLTENPNISKDLGTRHRAGLGLTEESDAVVIVVSEETGKISVCIHGQLHTDLDKEKLIQIIHENYIKK